MNPVILAAFANIRGFSSPARQSPVGWAGAGQSIVNVAKAEARAAGEVIEDDGEAHAKIVAFLENLKVI